LKRRNCLGSNSYVLALGGVARLRRVGIVASIGDKITVHSPQFMHQTLCSRYLLERAAVDGAEVWGGFAVGGSRSPVRHRELKRRFGKIPDGLIAPLLPGVAPGAGLDWVEVEHAPKGTADVLRVVRMATHSGKFLDDARTVRLGRVVIVYASRQGHENAMLKAVETLLAELSVPDGEALLEALVFVRCEFDPGVHRWSAYTESTGAAALAAYREQKYGKKTPGEIKSEMEAEKFWAKRKAEGWKPK
jgi:hypothetical protein